MRRVVGARRASAPWRCVVSAPDVRWKPSGDRAGVYVYVPRYGSWRRVDLPYGGCEVDYALPEGTVALVPEWAASRAELNREVYAVLDWLADHAEEIGEERMAVFLQLHRDVYRPAGGAS